MDMYGQFMHLENDVKSFLLTHVTFKNIMIVANSSHDFSSFHVPYVSLGSVIMSLYITLRTTICLSLILRNLPYA